MISPFYGDINLLDEGQYGAWIIHFFSGQHLYKDVYAAYGPLYIYPFYLLAKIFSPTVFLIRVINIVIYEFIGVIIVQLLLNKLKIQYYLQLFCIALLLIIPGYGIRQGLGLLSLLFVYNSVEEDSYVWSFLAGTTLVVTFLTSSDIGIFSTATSIFYILYKAVCVQDIGEYLKKIGVIFISYVFVFFGFYLWSVQEGWFYAYINTIFSDIKIYSSIDIAIGKNFPNAFVFMPHDHSPLQWIKFIISQEMLLYWLYVLYIITFIYLSIRIILKKISKEDKLFFLIALFGFMLSTILIGRMDHFAFTLTPTFILFVYYLKNLIPHIKQSGFPDRIFYLFFILVICFFSLRLISIYRPHFGNILSIPHAIANRKNTIKLIGPVAISEKQTKSIVTLQTFIKRNTTSKDSIYFFSNDPMYYFLVNINDPTKYDLPEVANVKDKRIDVLRDLQSKQPKYIFYDVSSYAVDGVSNYARLPEVTDFINKYYKKERIANYIIYERISSK